MKTETQIAKRFIKLRNGLVVSQCHKELCLRFLEFLDFEEDMYISLDFDKIEIDMKYWEKRLKDKITDLKTAIKVFEDKDVQK